MQWVSLTSGTSLTDSQHWSHQMPLLISTPVSLWVCLCNSTPVSSVKGHPSLFSRGRRVSDSLRNNGAHAQSCKERAEAASRPPSPPSFTEGLWKCVSLIDRQWPTVRGEGRLRVQC